MITGIIGVQAEVSQGQQLPDRVCDLAGQGRRAAASAAASAARPMSRNTDRHSPGGDVIDGAVPSGSHQEEVPRSDQGRGL